MNRSLNKELTSRLLGSLFLLLGGLLLLLVALLLLLGGVGEVLLELLETVHGHLGSGGDRGGELVGAAREGGAAALAAPDAGGHALDLLLSYQRPTLPQGGQTYLARCWSSNFLTILRMAPP
jgi:hypothetical protein